ncbi:tetratricopeptide repeat protein [Streptomyces sp. NPDC001231]|uniref:tetratricopeptide repeat protein n=1 Tax=Streptomyces sp. NPDC001231 TaxID=3364549 RepID=UPI00368964DC
MSEHTTASGSKPVDARHAYGVQVGDNNVQITTVVARAPGADVPPPAEWPLLRHVESPLHMGVHPTAMGRDGEPQLPPYVPRDGDAALHDALRAVAESGGLVLVLGESTAGKSRCAFEAARSVVPDHRLLHVPPQDLISGVQNIPDGMPVIVWLDDLEQYLGAARLTVPWLRLMRRKGVALLATMRVEEYSRLRSGPGGDGHRLAGDDVLRQADHVVRVERRWSSAELGRARGAEDSRLTEALTRSDEYGLGEYLAAGPDLMTAWLNGWAPGAHPRGAALVAAGVDLRRAGVRVPLALSMLEQLHGHYLRGRGGARLRPELLPQAVEWATAQIRATTSLLLPTDSEGHITVFDYLVDTTQRDAAAPPVPEVVWDAALRMAAEADRANVAEAAISEKQYDIAEGVFRELLDAGDEDALVGLCQALVGQFRLRDAEELLKQQLIATAVNPQRHAFCRSLLGMLLCAEERFAEAEVHLREALATESAIPGAGVYLGTILISQEKYAEAESLLRPWAEEGDTDACRVLGKALDGQGRRDESLPWFVKAAEAGDNEAMVFMGLAAQNDRDLVTAETWFRKAFALGGKSAENAGAFLAMILSAQTRFTEAEPFWRAVAETGGSPLAAHHLGQALLAQDRAGEAEPWLVQAAEDGYEGSTEARVLLGRALAAQGRADEALRWWREAAADGSSEAAYRIGFLLLDQGSSEGIEWLERAARAGESLASSRLGAHYAEAGQYEEAHRWLAQAAEAGVPRAAYILGLLLSQQERFRDAEEWFEKAVELGVSEASEHLATLRAQGAQPRSGAPAQQDERRADEAFAAGLRLRDAGQPDQSEASFRSAAEMGHADAAMMLGVALINRGSGNEGMAWLRGAAESGRSSGAALTLGLLLKEQGTLDEAESWLRLAEEGGQSSAAAELGKLLHGRDRREEAEPWLRKAAEAGNAEAAGILGVQLKDQGCTEEAWAMLYRAATTGYGLAATVLGLMCLEQEHSDAAIKWWQYAAQAGEPIGAHTLGTVWEQRGRIQDAIAMYTLAAEKGHADAIAALNRLRVLGF